MERKNNQNGNKPKDKIEEVFSDEKQITETLQLAIHEAIGMHKRAGNPLATWKDGKAIWIKTEDD